MVMSALGLSRGSSGSDPISEMLWHMSDVRRAQFVIRWANKTRRMPECRKREAMKAVCLALMYGASWGHAREFYAEKMG
jgi:hypothetical protein